MECDVLVSLGVVVQEGYRLLSIVVVEFREYGSILEVMYYLPSVFNKFFTEKISLVPVKVYYFLKFGSSRFSVGLSSDIRDGDELNQREKVVLIPVSISNSLCDLDPVVEAFQLAS